MAKILVDKLGVFGGRLSRRSVCMAVSWGGQFAAVSCCVPEKWLISHKQNCHSTFAAF